MPMLFGLKITARGGNLDEIGIVSDSTRQDKISLSHSGIHSEEGLISMELFMISLDRIKAVSK